jgi:curved DNA-binding protein CbpA
MQQNYLTYYQLLEVSVDATTEQIIAAYKEKAKKYHPDKNQGTEAANRMFQLLTDARDWLTDPIKRKQYNEIIGITAKPEPQPKIIYKQITKTVTKPSKPDNVELAGAAVVGGLVGLLIGVLFSDEE